jgi:Common central domain of tyrosinase
LAQLLLPSWIKNDKPTVKVPAVPGMAAMTITVTRSASHASGLPTATQLANLVKNTSIDYTQFTSQLEGYHNVVHGWVGGTMNNIMVSPSDPVVSEMSSRELCGFTLDRNAQLGGEFGLGDAQFCKELVAQNHAWMGCCSKDNSPLVIR